MAEILQFAELREITGYQRAADVERCLREQGIKFFWGRRGPWTTMHHLNHPGGQSDTGKSDDRRQIEF